MALVSTKEILYEAYRERFAVALFNIENLEMLKACISAAKQEKKPIIIQASEKTIHYIGMQLLYEMVKTISTVEGVTVALHLDHGKNLDVIRKACEAGFSSVMIDASDKDFVENIELTQRCVEMAQEYGVSVEAELGHVGGKKNDVQSIYTETEKAIEFIKKTEVDFLAIAIGTRHGIYHGTPALDFKRLAEIRKNTNIPLVLHGASGLADECLRKCILEGITKINFATELRRTGTDTLRNVFIEDQEIIDPREYGLKEQQAIEKCVLRYIQICTGGKGNLYG